MAKKASRKQTKWNLTSPIYFIPEGGGPGIKLVLTDGRWVVAKLSSRLIDIILAAPPCARLKSGACGGRCPSGTRCSTLLIPSFEYVPVPEIPGRRPGRDYVLTGVKRACVCL